MKRCRLSEKEKIDVSIPPPPTTLDNETLHSQEKGDWLIDEFLTDTTNELSTYRRFILDLTPYRTQHGTKGDEFEKVLVVFDDTEASWHNYSFSRFLTPHTTGKDPTEGQHQRSLNLAYVCFSRALKDLRIILFTTDPPKAKKELIEQGLFTDEQISIQIN
jgi:DNA helicase-2/ATP-dependent DNA helicase PcrA